MRRKEKQHSFIVSMHAVGLVLFRVYLHSSQIQNPLLILVFGFFCLRQSQCDGPEHDSIVRNFDAAFFLSIGTHRMACNFFPVSVHAGGGSVCFTNETLGWGRIPHTSIITDEHSTGVGTEATTSAQSRPAHAISRRMRMGNEQKNSIVLGHDQYSAD